MQKVAKHSFGTRHHLLLNESLLVTKKRTLLEVLAQ